MPDLNIKTNQSGFAALYLTLLILTASLALTASIFILTLVQQKNIQNIVKSSQSYYLAEAGIEDAILRIKKSLPISSNYIITIDSEQAAVSITSPNPSTRIIRATGTKGSVSKTLEVQLSIQSINPEFFYGAQAGDGGIEMDDLSVIDGNVFSNGSIIAEASGSRITGTAKVANAGNKIEKATILVDAYADICNNAVITGALYTNSNQSCTASSTLTLGQPPNPLSLPISQSQINNWKQEALVGGVSGSYNFSSGINYLGPKKIEGNLTVQNDAQLLITGTLWVTGAINIQNNSLVKLDSASYGNLSGEIIGDSLITLENNSTSTGTGQTGSYLMYISTSPLKPAIIVKNNAQVDIIFTLNGWIEIINNTILREVTGYGIELKNNVRISYEVGLRDVSFSSGPGGSWKVVSWKEVE